jgi:hypothetical protein
MITLPDPFLLIPKDNNLAAASSMACLVGGTFNDKSESASSALGLTNSIGERTFEAREPVLHTSVSISMAGSGSRLTILQECTDP